MKKVYKLKNGLNVYLQSARNHCSVNILINVECGAFYPKKQKMGTAHMLEHNIFFEEAGNKTIEEKLGELGTFVEALTYDFNTAFSVHTFKEHTDKCIELLMDKIFNAKFNEKFFKNEKKVIYQEYLKQRNNAMSANAFRASEKFYSGTIIDNSGYGIGTKKQIDAIQFEDMLKFYKSFYRFENASVIIVGNFDKRKTLKTIKKMAYKIDRSKKEHENFKITSLGFSNKSSIKVINKQEKLRSSCVELMFSGVNETNSGKWAFDVLANMLCGLSTSSLLKKKLRNELGIIYTCDASTDKSICYENCGTISIRYFVDNSEIVHSIFEVLNCLKGVCSNEFLDVFRSSKQCVINDLIIKCESIEKFCILHAYELMYENRAFDLKKAINQISRITYNDIVNSIQHLLTHKICISVTGEKINTEDIKKGLKSYTF